MSAYRTTLAQSARPFSLSALLQLPRRFLARSALARSRQGLARLDDHLLQDIGISRDEALEEAARGGWDAPSHWRA